MTPALSVTLLIHLSDQHVAEIRLIAFQARCALPTLAGFLLERALLKLATTASCPVALDDSLSQIDPRAAQIMHCALAELFDVELRDQARARKLGVAELARILLVSSLEPTSERCSEALSCNASVSPGLPERPRASWLNILSRQITSDFEFFDSRIRAQHLFSIHESRTLNDLCSGVEISADSRRI